MIKYMFLIFTFLTANYVEPYPERIIVDRFDRVEVNHYCNEWGIEQWTQVIFWDVVGSNAIIFPKVNEFHVQHWVMLQNCYIKTEKGEKEWEKRRDEIELKLRSLEDKISWRRGSEYQGEFDKSHQFYPKRDWKNRIWMIQYVDKHIIRRIEAREFIETRTLQDPERIDKQKYPETLRRGLTPRKKYGLDDFDWDSISAGWREVEAGEFRIEIR